MCCDVYNYQLLLRADLNLIDSPRLVFAVQHGVTNSGLSLETDKCIVRVIRKTLLKLMLHELVISDALHT